MVLGSSCEVQCDRGRRLPGRHPPRQIGPIKRYFSTEKVQVQLIAATGKSFTPAGVVEAQSLTLTTGFILRGHVGSNVLHHLALVFSFGPAQ